MEMINLSINVQDAGSNSKHRFSWDWNLSDLPEIEKNGKTVFSCFSGGGGSSMGYKLAGYNVVGNLEIDKMMEEVYVKNLAPQQTYNMDIRDFNQLKEYPDELKNLDILDGSPPCTTFSIAGNREDTWGVEKVFNEGQEKQRLDDLFFYFIHTAEILKPKIIVAENVKGLIMGNAKGYVNEIFKKLRLIGYEPQLFLLNSATMGVPQRRERCFFIAHKKEMIVKDIKLEFNEPLILFKSIRSEHGRPVKKDTELGKLIPYRRISDRNFGSIAKRVEGKYKLYTQVLLHENEVANTITASGKLIRFVDGEEVSIQDLINTSTFPQDYDFCGKTNKVQYICGMSVPPVMMANVAAEIYEQWLK